MTNKKRKEISENEQDNFSDAETIQYAEPYRNTSKKDEIYRRKAKKKTIKTLTKPLYDKESRAKLKRKADNKLAEIIDKVDSDGETIPYAEPYNSGFIKKDEIYRNRAKKKAIRTLTKKKKRLANKTTKVVEPKENHDVEITGFKAISHPRAKKHIKEKAVARANSAAVQSNLIINLEDLVDVPLLFNLKMTSEMEIEDWLVGNLAINNDEYYIEHKQGTNVFTIRKEPDIESNNSY